jgi:hypothetical protein
VVLGGSGGGVMARHAGLLTSHGFPTLALAYFNYPGRPPVLADQPLEYFADAFAWLRRRPEARGQRVRLVGASRGGELVLLLGATFPDDVAAVVAYVPSSVLWGGVGAPGHAAWTHRGAPLPYMDNRGAATSNDPHRRFLQQMEDVAVVERATIPVERTRGPILLVPGTAEGLWPCTLFWSYPDSVNVRRVGRRGRCPRHEISPRFAVAGRLHRQRLRVSVGATGPGVSPSPSTTRTAGAETPGYAGPRRAVRRAMLDPERRAVVRSWPRGARASTRADSSHGLPARMKRPTGMARPAPISSQTRKPIRTVATPPLPPATSHTG